MKVSTNIATALEIGLLLTGSLQAQSVLTVSVSAHMDVYRAGGYDDGSDGTAPAKFTFPAAPSILSLFGADELVKARTIYGTGSDDAALARAVFRDANFAAPSRWAAGRAPEQTKVYLYRFSYVRQRQIGRVPGAPHGSEIPYMFDSWRQSPAGGRFLADADRAEATMLHACWVSFAKAGSPACPGVPAWPAYRKQDDDLLDFGSAAVVRRGQDARQLEFMEAHILRQDGLQ
jgi:para-nitrobenzyl esterase